MKSISNFHKCNGNYFSSILIALILFTFLPYQKINAQYTTVPWGTYFYDASTGFSFADDELIDDIKIDNQTPENIYVVGRTRSAIGSSASCNGNTLNYGKGDVVIAKYNACGQLIWSKYLGNKKKTDYGYSLALDYDEAGNTSVYIAGEMKTSGTAPEAIICDGGASVFQNKPKGTWDGFVAKYDGDGNLLRWTYLGGSDAALEKVDQILGVAVWKHNVFITGYTESSDLHEGALLKDDSTLGGGGDGFLAEFSSDLHSLEYFTYIGGDGKDRCHGIKIYDNGIDPVSIFVDGTTPSSDEIAEGNCFDNSLDGDLDGFVGKWNDGSGIGLFRKLWCTYIGGSGIERARDMDVDDAGNIIIVGQTNSTTLAFAKSYDNTYNGGTDAFVIKLPNEGGTPLWGTYFGGYADEEAVGLVWKKGLNGNHVIIGGITYSSQKTSCLPDPNPNNFTEFPLVNPIIAYINGKKSISYCPATVGDAFIAEFNDDPSNVSLVFSTYFGGKGNEVNGENQLSYNPSFAVNAEGNLYVAFNSISSDIHTALGPALGKGLEIYHGGIDAYIAKLTDGSLSNFACNYLREETEATVDLQIIDDGIQVYPNPSANIFNLKITAAQEGEAHYQIYDVMGRLITSQTKQLESGTNVLQVDLEKQTTGIYLLFLSYENKSYEVKLMKQ